MTKQKTLKTLSVLFLTFLLMCIAAVFAACTPEETTNLSATITNKDDLTAAWFVGGDDRTLEYEIPEGYTAEIVSDNPEAVRIEGETLIPMSSGTALITLTAGRKTDTVEVEVRPAYTAVNVLNRDALTAVWALGEADRTVEASPVLGGDYTVTSSNPDIVSVSGKTLTAVGAGEVRITVSSGIYTDNLVVSVRPGLTSMAIANKQEIAAQNFIKDETCELELAFLPADSYTLGNTEYSVISDNEAVVSVDGLLLTAKGTGTANVTVTAYGKSDFVTVKVVEGRPVMYADDDPCQKSVIVLQGNATSFQIPEITARDYRGQQIDNVVCELSDRENMNYNAEDGTLTLDKKGEYSLEFTAADPEDPANVSTLTIVVQAYRNLIKAATGTDLDSSFRYVDGAQFVDDSEQVLTSDYGDLIFGQFDMQPSTHYYAEVTYHITSPSVSVLVGMSHSRGSDDPMQWLASWVDRGSFAEQRNFRTKYFDIAGNMNWNNTWSMGAGTNIYYLNRLGGYWGIESNDDGKQLTYAVARDGDMYYTFINGKYVMSCTCSAFGDEGTVPGLFGQQFRASDGGVTVSGIVYYNDADQVAEKLESLGTSVYGVHKWNSYNDYSVSDDSSLGLNFTFTNDWGNYKGDTDGGYGQLLDGVTANTVFDGNFRVEWDYVNTKSVASHAICWGMGAFLSVMRADCYTDWNEKDPSGYEILKLGSFVSKDHVTDTSVNVFLHGAINESLQGGGHYVDSSCDLRADFTGSEKSYTATAAHTHYQFANNDKIHFSLMREMTENGSRYTMQITIDGGTITRVMTVEDASPVMLIWQNGTNVGTVSNIVWTTNTEGEVV